MDPNSGKLYRLTDDEAKAEQRRLRRKLVPLTEQEAAVLEPLNRKARRQWAKQNLPRAERMRRRAHCGW
jgi:hypothetical protein